MERPYVINPLVGSIMKSINDKLIHEGHDSQNGRRKAESNQELDVEQLLDEIYKGCGMAKEQQKQNDCRVKALNRLLDYICEKSKAAISKDELLSLYRMYIREWVCLMMNKIS